MTEEAMRKAFEAWVMRTAPKHGSVKRCRDGSYAQGQTEVDWRVWQAATRAAVPALDHVASELAAAHTAPRIVWPVGKDAMRTEDMGPGNLRVGLDSDNDVWVAVYDGKRSTSVEFCNPGGGGGGRSSKTRMALIALMVAMEADNADRPIPAAPEAP